MAATVANQVAVHTGSYGGSHADGRPADRAGGRDTEGCSGGQAGG